MIREDYINHHPKPIFRGNYNIILGINFKTQDHLRFEYCGNNKLWVAFGDNGGEIGVLTEKGVKYAESLVNPEAVKKLYNE